MENVYDMITENDMTPDLRLLNEVLGIEQVRILLDKLNGVNFYIPKISHLDSLVVKYIAKFPCKSLKQIACELGVSEPYLKNLTKKEQGDKLSLKLM